MKFIMPVTPKTANVEDLIDTTGFFWRDTFNDDSNILEINSIAKVGDYYLAGVSGTSTKYLVTYDFIDWETGFFPQTNTTLISFIIETYNNVFVSEINSTLNLSSLRLRDKRVSPFFGAGFGALLGAFYRYKKVRYNNLDYVCMVGIDSTDSTKLVAVIYHENSAGSNYMSGIITLGTYNSLTLTDLQLYLSNIEWSEYEESFVFMMTKTNADSKPKVIYLNINESVYVAQGNAFFYNKKCSIRYFYNQLNTNHLWYVATQEGGLYYSTDDVATYSTLTSLLFGGFRVMEIQTVIEDSAGKVYFIETSTNSIYYSNFEIADMFTSVTLGSSNVFLDKELALVSNHTEYVENKILSGDTILEYDKATDLFKYSYSSHRRGSIVLHNNYKYRALKTTNEIPSNDKINWELVGYNNELACFNSSYDFKTTKDTSLTINLDYDETRGWIKYLCLMNLYGESCLIYVNNVLVQTIDLNDRGITEGSWFDYFFSYGAKEELNLFIAVNEAEPQIRIEITGTTCYLGYVFCGDEVLLGETNLGTSTTLVDYSRKEADGDGNYFLEEKRSNKSIDYQITINRGDVNTAFERVEAVKVTPTVWYDCDINNSEVLLYGFVKDFSVVFSTPSICECSLSIEGLI